MYRSITVALILVVLAGCSSALVEQQEGYRGPVGAAVLPVGGAGRTAAHHRADLGDQIQRLVARELGASGIFAHVSRLTAANAANEADVLIKPVLLELRWRGTGYRQGEIQLRIKATQKSDRSIILDKTYKGDCRDCRVPAGVPPVAGPLEKPLQKLAKDLRRKLD